MPKYSEEDIIVQVQRQNLELAIKQIVEVHSDRLYAHVIRMVKEDANAKDVLQNIFVKVWKGLPRFRQDSKLSTWLYRIATNESITFLNKQKRSTTSELSPYTESHVVDGPSSHQIEQKLNAALATLPFKQKQVFILRYFDELKYKEMSQILDTSEGALKASYHHAVKKIEDFLKED